MKDTDHHDGVLIRLIEDQVVAELRRDEPANLDVTWCGIANPSPKFTMLCQEIGGVENGLADTFRSFGIVATDETAVLVQIANGLWTEPGFDLMPFGNSQTAGLWY